MERRAEELGIEYGYLMISSLLFMNGSHASSDIEQLKNMLTVLEYVCNRCI